MCEERMEIDKNISARTLRCSQWRKYLLYENSTVREPRRRRVIHHNHARRLGRRLGGPSVRYISEREIWQCIQLLYHNFGTQRRAYI